MWEAKPPTPPMNLPAHPPFWSEPFLTGIPKDAPPLLLTMSGEWGSTPSEGEPPSLEVVWGERMVCLSEGAPP